MIDRFRGEHRFRTLDTYNAEMLGICKFVWFIRIFLMVSGVQAFEWRGQIEK